MTTLFERSWQRAWNNLHLPAPPDGLRERLMAAYGEPARHYHTQQHLQECLAHFDGAIAGVPHPGEVELALWFHDAVYDPQGKDNERRSADWAAAALAEHGLAAPSIARIDDLIMATCHVAAPAGPDQQLLVDIDLAILGAAPDRFAEYDRQVRAEYAWVPEEIYRIKRREVLQGFLSRASIYSTPGFRTACERQARLNLQAAIG